MVGGWGGGGGGGVAEIVKLNLHDRTKRKKIKLRAQKIS